MLRMWLASVLEGKKKRINYLGWLGYGNLGDEGLYEALKGIFHNYQYQLIPARIAFEDHSVLSPVTIIGGSTGIPDWIEWLRFTKYNYIFGAGVKDPTFYGYHYLFREKHKVSVEVNRLRNFRYIGVRGDISKALLATWGIKAEVIGDPCLSLQPLNPSKKAEDKIAISVGSDEILWGMSEERVFHEIGKVCETLKKENYEIILIPFWKENVARVRRLSRDENVSFFDDWFDIESTINLIAQCKILIGQKLHSLGFSAVATTPFIGLEYQPKVYEFAQSLGFENFTVRTDEVAEKRIMKLFNDLLENYDEMQKELARRVETYRKRQKQFAACIIRDIDSLAESCWEIPSSQRRIRNKLLWGVDFLFHKKPVVWDAWNRLFFLNAMRYFT